MATHPKQHPPSQQQLEIPQLQEELELRAARVLYARSRFLSSRYATFDKLMAQPLVARCLRLAAKHNLRLAQLPGNRPEHRPPPKSEPARGDLFVSQEKEEHRRH